MKHRGAHVSKKQVQNRLMKMNEVKFCFYQREWSRVFLSTQRFSCNVNFFAKFCFSKDNGIKNKNEENYTAAAKC